MSEPAVEPVEPVEPGGDEGGGEPFSISQEQWEQTQAQLAEAAELVQAVRASQPQDGPLSGYDPEFRQELDQYLEQKLTPYQAYQQESIQRAAEETLRDMYHDVSVREGEFDADMARRRYEDIIPAMVQKHGQTIRAAEEAVAASARAQREYEQQIREKAVEQYQNQLRGISTAPREPSNGAAPAAQQHVTPLGGDELDLVRSHFPSSR